MTKSERQAIRRRNKIAAGICINCPEPVEMGRRTCARHTELHREADRRRQQERRELGVCWCGAPLSSTTLCQEHLDQTLAYVRSRLPNGKPWTPGGTGRPPIPRVALPPKPKATIGMAGLIELAKQAALKPRVVYNTFNT